MVNYSIDFLEENVKRFIFIDLLIDELFHLVAIKNIHNCFRILTHIRRKIFVRFILVLQLYYNCALTFNINLLVLIVI